MTRPQPNQRNPIELPRPISLPSRNTIPPCPCGQGRRMRSQLAILQLSVGIIIGLAIGNLIVLMAISSTPRHVPAPHPSSGWRRFA